MTVFAFPTSNAVASWIDQRKRVEQDIGAVNADRLQTDRWPATHPDVQGWLLTFRDNMTALLSRSDATLLPSLRYTQRHSALSSATFPLSRLLRCRL
jgi:hypothetical protein